MAVEFELRLDSDQEKPEIKAVDLVVLSGFGDYGILELKGKLEKIIRPENSIHIPTTPWNRAFTDPNRISEKCTKIIDDLPNDKIVIGDSYGAFFAALYYARREKFQDILKVILIDGPLNPYVDVPPALIKFWLFIRHYRARVELALECVQRLEDPEKTERIITMGSMKDRIVSPLAKKFPFQKDNSGPMHIELQSRGHSLSSKKNNEIVQILQKYFAEGVVCKGGI